MGDMPTFRLMSEELFSRPEQSLVLWSTELAAEAALILGTGNGKIYVL